MQWTNYKHHKPVLWHNHVLIVKSCFVCCSNKYWFTGLFYVLSRLIVRLTEQQFRLQSTCFIWEIISCWINCYFAFLVILFFWHGFWPCSVEQPVHMDCHFCATHVYVILMCGVALLPSALVMQQPARVSGKSLLHIVEGRGNVFGLNYLWVHSMVDSVMLLLQFSRGVLNCVVTMY